MTFCGRLNNDKIDQTRPKFYAIGQNITNFEVKEKNILNFQN